MKPDEIPPSVYRRRMDEEIAKEWRLHQWRTAARRRAGYRHLSINIARRSTSWNLTRDKRIAVAVDDTATAIQVHAVDDDRRFDSPFSIFEPLVVHLLFRDERGELCEAAPTKYSLGRGRRLVFLPPSPIPAAESCRLEIEYRESLLGRLAASVLRPWEKLVTGDAEPLLAGAIPRDFCLGELGSRELRSPAVWSMLAVGLVAIPALIAGLIALVLAGIGVSREGIGFGMGAGALIAFFGTCVCGSTVSLLAASVGGIPISGLLGAMYGYLLDAAGGFAGVAARFAGTAPVFVGFGGLPAILRPPVQLVLMTAISIAILSAAMGSARRANGTDGGAHGGVIALAKAILLSGAGPGLIFAINLLVARVISANFGFGIGLASIGGIAFGAAVAVRSRKSRRGLVFGMVYFASMLLLVSFGASLPQASPLRLLLATAAQHICLQGTFFALAYVLGERSGGPRDGVIASTVEGVGGYVAFLATYHGYL
jgi:hypothetical protein